MDIERKILILKENQDVWTYIIEDDEIVEIHYENVSESNETIHQIGNIYIGKVKKIVKNIGAAFVEIEPGLECYYDLTQGSNAIFTSKVGKKPLSVSDELVVQLSKEGIKGKAPTVTSEISFTGYYTVLTTGNTRIGVSAKIPKSQREELKKIVQEYENNEYGIIVRTNGKDVPAHRIQEEVKSLIQSYEHLRDSAPMRTCFSILKKAPPHYIKNIRNVYGKGLSKILVNDQKLCNEIREFYEAYDSTHTPTIQLESEKGVDLASIFNVRKILERALNEKVWLRNGAYLVIQPTEALTAIDVNSGKYEKKETDQKAALKINLEAATEIAKQLRLRNISGIIIVDFINMENEEDVEQLVKELKQHLSKDNVQTTFVDVTKLQLVEITRKKIRKTLLETLTLANKRV